MYIVFFTNGSRKYCTVRYGASGAPGPKIPVFFSFLRFTVLVLYCIVLVLYWSCVRFTVLVLVLELTVTIFGVLVPMLME